MQIIVNGEPRWLEAATLAALLVEMELDEAVVATALNGTFVPAARRPGQALAPGDRVEIVAPTQGG